VLYATRPLFLLDAFRVPYTVSDEQRPRGLETLGRANHGAPQLCWPADPAEELKPLRFAGTPLFGSVVDRQRARALLDLTGRAWRDAEPVTDGGGHEVSRVLRASDGSIFLPFDPEAALDALLTERYVEVLAAGSRRLIGAARSTYYRVRPLLPRRFQLALRRRFTRVQERASFPSWPVETALHRLQAQLLGLVEEIAGEPLPWIEFWPNGRRWAVILTHDVERAPGYGHVEALVDVERRHGLRSAWYFVPERDYAVEQTLLDSLRGDGFEIGLHGLHHDGRDLDAGEFEQRLPRMRAYAAQWGATGFRSPATHRHRGRLASLGLDHDSSYCDVARYEPQPGGTCSWLPFQIDSLVELPITIPMDHTLFELLGSAEAREWWEKASDLRDHGGMAVVLTHPDYLLEPSRLRVYERFVEWLAADADAWHALPRDVSAWWRRRAASLPVRHGDAWHVEGPAGAEARIRTGLPTVPT
jgi:peptidoglycan/xylan/chitin deacetylase (PgdA/CDA1 family)